MTQDSSVNMNDTKKKFFSKAMLHNGRQNVITNFKLMVIIFILHIMAMPMLIISAMIQMFENGKAFDLDIYAVIAVFTTGMGAAAGLICALSVFSYLYKKTDVDMRMGLPMSTSQRFVSDFLSGLFIYIVPFAAAQIITWILMLIGHLGFDGKTFYIHSNDDPIEVTSSWTCDVFSTAAPFLWRIIIGGILLMVMFYTVTVFVASLCGNIFESIGYNILLNILVPLVAYMLISAVMDNAPGVSIDRYAYKTISLCGPFGGVVGLVMSLNAIFYEDDITVYSAYYTYPQWCLLFLLIIVLLVIGTYLIYRKRKAEDTGKPVVFGAFYHVILTLSMFCICYAFLVDDGSEIVPMLIITAIVYLVFHVVRNRGFGHILKGIAAYVITIVVAAGTFLLIEKTEGFGIGTYVPDPASVKCVYIPYTGFNEQSQGELAYFDIYSKTPTKLTQPENIQTVTDMHKRYIELMKNDQLDYDFSQQIEVIYKLKTGKTVFRFITLDEESIKKLMAMDTTDDLRTARADDIENRLGEFAKTADNYRLDKDKNNVEVYESYSVVLSPQWKYNENGQSADGSISVLYSSLPADFTDNLAKALRNDIMNETEENYYKCDLPGYQLSVGYVNIDIMGDYTAAIEYLRSCGLDASKLSTVTERVAKGYVNSNMMSGMSDLGLASYANGTEFRGNTYYLGSGFCFSDYVTYGDNVAYEIRYFSSLNEYYDDIAKLLEVSRKRYKSDDVRYNIIVDGTEAAIPAEYNELAERVFIRSAADCFIEQAKAMDDTGNMSGTYQRFLSKFTEYYGRDKIVSAIGYYYGKDAASDIYSAMNDFIAAVQNGVPDELYEDYNEYGDYEVSIAYDYAY